MAEPIGFGTTLLEYLHSLVSNPFNSPNPQQIYQNSKTGLISAPNAWAGAQSIAGRGPSLSELFSPSRFIDAAQAASSGFANLPNELTAHPFIPYQLPPIYPKTEAELINTADTRMAGGGISGMGSTAPPPAISALLARLLGGF